MGSTVAGVPHTALYDAQVQAIHMRRIYRAKIQAAVGYSPFAEPELHPARWPAGYNPAQRFYPPADAATGLSTPAVDQDYMRRDPRPVNSEAE